MVQYEGHQYRLLSFVLEVKRDALKRTQLNALKKYARKYKIDGILNGKGEYLYIPYAMFIPKDSLITDIKNNESIWQPCGTSFHQNTF